MNVYLLDDTKVKNKKMYSEYAEKVRTIIRKVMNLGPEQKIILAQTVGYEK